MAAPEGLLYSSITLLNPLVFRRATNFSPSSLVGFLFNVKSTALPSVCSDL